MTKHTPGPWTLCRETFNNEVIGFHISASPHGSIKPVCECRDGKAIEANGLLIAAAPDLLAALKEARAQLENYELAATGESYNSPQINAAIAKAEP